jgi:uncharacterized protein YcfJ
MRRLSMDRARKVGGFAAGALALAGVSGCNNAGEGALFGAGLGAGGGAIIGSLFGEAGAGAAIGAVSGALFGGVVGDQNQRNASYARSNTRTYETRTYHYYEEPRHVCHSSCGCAPKYSRRSRNWDCY